MGKKDGPSEHHENLHLKTFLKSGKKSGNLFKAYTKVGKKGRWYLKLDKIEKTPTQAFSVYLQEVEWIFSFPQERKQYKKTWKPWLKEGGEYFFNQKTNEDQIKDLTWVPKEAECV